MPNACFAQWRERGLVQLLGRGASKVGCVVLFYALAHNMVCGFRLPARVGPGSRRGSRRPR
jgi:hypothetical protein